MDIDVPDNKSSLKKPDEQVFDHLPKSHQLMLKIDELAQEKLNELLEPVRRGEMTLEDLKRSRGLM